MATKAKQTPNHEQPLPEPSKGDWHDLADRVAENPLIYVGAGLFIIVAAITGWLIRVYQMSEHQAFATEYARAFDNQDKAEIVTALKPLAEEKQEALYMLGETAYMTGDFETAADAFTRMRQDHPDSPFVPDAVEGLGFIAESNKDFAEAKQHYQDVIENWPGSFAAKRQQFNIGRCEQTAGNTEAAIDAYRAQSLAFPNSRVATRSNTIMAQLQAELGPVDPEADSDLESALDAVLESTSDAEEISEIDGTAETPPVLESQQLELTLPAPGEGAGVAEENASETP
jgi:tetratricopeptide (TPR) repeat protein